MHLRTWKFKLKNAKLAKDLFKKWSNDYRYAYNKSNWLKNEHTEFLSDYDTRDLITPKEVTSHIPWFLETPKDIRVGAVFENCKNFKSAFTNLKNKNITYFNMGYLKKKSKTFSLNIPGSAIKVSKSRKFIQIYNSYTNNFWFQLSKPIPKECINEKHFLLKEHKMYFNGDNYYLCLVLERNTINFPNKKNLTAIDPGVRKLVTTWDSTNKSYKFGENKSSQIKLLLKKRDMYQSKNDFKNYNRIEIRIKNLVNELHHQASTFLCKRYKNIILPVLDVKQLVKKVENKEYRKAILRMSICKFNELLKTKGDIYNTNIITENVSEAYSSRMCSSCLFINKKCSNELKKCNKCLKEIDRDVNGAKNIYFMNRHLV